MDSRSKALQPRTVNEIGGLRAAEYQGPPIVPEIRIKALSQFPGDQIFAAAAVQLEVMLTPDAAYPYTLLKNLRGFRCINVLGAVLIDVNGGGTRQVLDKDTWDFVNVNSIRFVIPALGSVVFQQWGE